MSEAKTVLCPQCGLGVTPGERCNACDHHPGQIVCPALCEPAVNLAACQTCKWKWDATREQIAAFKLEVKMLRDSRQEVFKICEKKQAEIAAAWEQAEKIATALDALIDRVKHEHAEQRSGGHFQWKPTVIAAEAAAKVLADYREEMGP